MKVAAALALIAILFFATGCGKKRRKIPTPPVDLRGYAEEGIASWYGYPYHGRAAANGEIYDMEQLTAAHRTLPFGTWVLVRSLENGKQVTVRINDRGPFVNGRVIDLSRAAARQIDLIGPGTARVKLTVTAAPLVAQSAEHFAVQLGAFQDRDRAIRLRDQMRAGYGKAEIVLRPGAPALWRVLVGDEPTPEAAGALARRLRSEERAAFVVRLDSASPGI
ncbi:MAG: septal ring lytic transglycosylase RlpA family protein [Bryobacterales bacterium]|nr:septal ring lytic transglycosylase RlpA family protein [Bryobacterales bacterium]